MFHPVRSGYSIFKEFFVFVESARWFLFFTVNITVGAHYFFVNNSRVYVSLR